MDVQVCAACSNLLLDVRGHLECPVCHTVDTACCEGALGDPSLSDLWSPRLPQSPL